MAKTDRKGIVTVAVKTDCGRVRDRNEDACFGDDEAGLLIVADGLGGHAGGDQASRLAIETLAGALREWEPSVPDSPAITAVITKAFEQATQRIREVACADYHLKEMGTTAVLALCGDEYVWIAHLGDSRAYLLRNHTFTQLTQDHSMVEDMVRAGLLSPDESHAHPQRHVVTRSLGQIDDITPTISVVEWSKGDVLLLCTDGLTNMLSDHDIHTTIRQAQTNVPDLCDRLVDAANERGGRDNITVAMAQHI
jgi:PPM family protein phosphatase